MRRSSTTGPRPSAGRSQSVTPGLSSPDVTPVKDDGFESDAEAELSEPEGWELDSTDGGSESSSVAAVDAPTESAGSTPSVDLAGLATSDMPQVENRESDSIRRVGTPPLSGDESAVMVDTPAAAPREAKHGGYDDAERWQAVNDQEFSADERQNDV